MSSTGSDTPAGAFDKLLILVGIVAAAAMVLAVFAVARGGESISTASGAVAPQTVFYELSEFAIEGDTQLISAPTTLEVNNSGAIVHNLVFENGGPASPDLNAGESAAVDVGTLDPGTYTIFCSIPGHREAGMETTIVVGEESSGSGGHQSGQDTEPDWDALDAAMTNSILAFPAETEGKGNQPLEPIILPDGTKEFSLTVSIEKWEVEPGKFVDAWTYNGQVPGPEIRVDVGDKVRVIVDNQLPMGTDVHWHGVQTPNNMDGVSPLTQKLIESGETFVYEFTARKPTIGMYHSHHHGQLQIPNGLFGTFIIGATPVPRGMTVSGVEIPADLEVSQEIPMVLNDAGVIGLSLNGKSFPATEPYVGKVGDWVVINYYNEGLQSHPMHQHQFPQLIFAKDGIPLDQPYWADTINVAPGERYSVLIQLEEAGVWVFHCHILTHVEREEGMFGMVTAWIVEEV